SFAETLNFKGLVIEDFWIKSSIGNHKMTSGYLKIKNTNNFDERLTSVVSDFSKKIELHGMALKNDIMTMKKLDNGLMIRAGTEVHLRPGNYHLMFINLNGQVKVMNSYKVNFIFENSGSVMIDMPVLEKKFKVDYNHNHKH
ncbi:copper chaperone PCu(A)C, partial [Alphaproteobacteria bacterium]|nr:copper chaperone PCu(A)C [Alphaproteobacteria bacterium]